MIIHLFGHGGVSLCRVYQCINISLRVFANTAGCLSNHHFPFLSIWLAEPALAVQAGNVTASTASLAIRAWTYDSILAKGTERKICEEFLENVFLPNKI